MLESAGLCLTADPPLGRYDEHAHLLVSVRGNILAQVFIYSICPVCW